MTIKETVFKNIDHLKTLDVRGLTEWAKSNGMDSRSGFSHFKKALLVNGICYDKMKDQRQMDKAAACSEQVTHTVVLYSDAKAKNDRFGITDKDGNPLWYGLFFDNDRDYEGDQASGEMAAAKKAVWLASKIAAMTKGGTIKLILRVDAQWLIWANPSTFVQDQSKGGKAVELRKAAERLGVVLFVEWIKGENNPADEYTTCKGFKKWQDNNYLAELAEAIK